MSEESSLNYAPVLTGSKHHFSSVIHRTCVRCGAIVDKGWTEKHDTWHALFEGPES